MKYYRNVEVELFFYRRRLILVGVLMGLGFALLIGRLLVLQVFQHEVFTQKAYNNRTVKLPITPPRGVIFDRQGRVLASNHSVFALDVNPRKVDDLDELLTRLRTVVKLSAREEKRLKQNFRSGRGEDTISIKTGLSNDEVSAFAVQSYQFPEITVNADLIRLYPQQSVAAHAIGYISRINEKELENLKATAQETNYRGTKVIGKLGVEQRYERLLHGDVGAATVEVRRAGYPVRQLSSQAPTSGKSLVMTIDADLQAHIEKLYGEHRGALVAIEPNSGDVLAMVSMPSFNPNAFVGGISTLEWDELNTSIDKPLLNRAIAGTYPPGSTLKPFLSLIALKDKFRKASDKFPDPGFFELAGTIFRDDKVGGHGALVAMEQAIAESCNTYFYILANDMGVDNIYRGLSQFGFGAMTEIDISGERKGILPSRDWKRDHFRKSVDKRWYAGETISLGIGQGYHEYTIMQLARATAILATQGRIITPRLVRGHRDGREMVVYPNEPTGFVKVDQSHWKTIRDAMIKVTKPGGTAGNVFAGVKYQVAGKTGTSQVKSLHGETYVKEDVAERNRDHGLFIAFAPVDQPKIAIAALVENAGFGSGSAAPIVRSALDYYLLSQTEPGPPVEGISTP